MQVHDPEGRFPAKGLMPFLGKRIMDWQVEALLDSPYVERVYILGLSEDQTNFHHDSVECIPVETTSNVPEKLLAGIHWLKNSGSLPEMVVVSSSDAPGVHTDCIDEFFAGLDQLQDYDFVPSLVPEEVVEAIFPKSGRVVARFRDVHVFPGELFALSVGAIERGQEVIAEVHARRRMINRKTDRIKLGPLVRLMLKSPSAWLFLIKFLLGLATLEDAENAVSRAFNGRVKAIIIPDAGFGMDIDLPEDLERLKAYMRLEAPRQIPAMRSPSD
jgi:hypothetical protein